MALRTIIDPRMQNAIPDLWPSRVSFFNVVTTPNVEGQPVVTTYTAIPSMTNLECRLAPFFSHQGRVTDNEIRGSKITELFQYRTCKINGNIPAVPRKMVAVVNEIMYQVRGVEQDSQSFCTQVRLEILKP